MKQMIDFLLTNASPSIVLRTRRDILHNLTAADAHNTLSCKLLTVLIGDKFHCVFVGQVFCFPWAENKLYIISCKNIKYCFIGFVPLARTGQ